MKAFLFRTQMKWIQGGVLLTKQVKRIFPSLLSPVYIVHNTDRHFSHPWADISYFLSMLTCSPLFENQLPTLFSQGPAFVIAWKWWINASLSLNTLPISSDSLVPRKAKETFLLAGVSFYFGLRTLLFFFFLKLLTFLTWLAAVHANSN